MRVHLGLLIALLLAAACAGEPPNRPISRVTVMESGVTGVFLDEGGTPQPDRQVAACMQTACFFTRTGLDGRFTFPIDPPARVALKTDEDLGSTPRQGAVLCPVQVDSRAAIDVGPLRVPTLPSGSPLGPVTEDPQTLTVGDGLELTLSRSALSPAVGDVLVDVAARRVPLSQVCSQLSLKGEDIIAVFALHPFGTTSELPISVRLASDLEKGTRVNFRTINEIDGHLSDPVPGRSDGSHLATDPSSGIRELTWLVISRFPNR